MRIGRRIRDARERAGLTQKELAERCGLSRVYVIKLESGEHDNPTIKVLQAIAKALKVPLTDLIS
jgi:transcriptional regulator with XRE-family HTH domain